MQDSIKSYGPLAYDIQEIVIPADEIQVKIIQLARILSNDSL